MTTENKPIRALHILGSLRRGGIETWLMNVIRLRYPDLQIDFALYAQPGESGPYEQEAIRLGSKILYFPQVGWLKRRLLMLGLVPTNHTLQKFIIEGHYDVVHAHGEEFHGDTMKEAYLGGAKVRVAHCHSTVLARGKGGPEMWLRWLRHVTVDRARVRRFGTDFIACSQDAGRLLLGAKWDTDKRSQVIYCGVPLASFEHAQRNNLRSFYLDKYKLPHDAIIIGHVGSMGPTPVKNQSFLVKLFKELATRDSRYHLFMAGDGPLKPVIEAEVKAYGLEGRVRTPGVVDDVPSLMTHLYNVHVMPSIAEGFGMTVTEATAAGLASVISDAIPLEVSEKFPGRTHRLSLTAGTNIWLDRIEAAVREQEPAKVGISRVKNSPLCLDQSAQDLIKMYRHRLI